LKSYSGHFVLTAIEEYFGKVKKIKIPAELKSVQLNPKMEVVESGKMDGLKTFHRYFAGVYYDCCVLGGDITYHASSIAQCITGWKKKKRLSKAGAKIINMRTCIRLEFCPTGVRSFCSSNSIDSHESYTVEELKKIVKKDLSYNLRYYGHELTQLGVL
jgi:hypothetical protein